MKQKITTLQINVNLKTKYNKIKLKAKQNKKIKQR